MTPQPAAPINQPPLPYQTVTNRLPPLWPQLDPLRQRQLAQHLADLLQRTWLTHRSAKEDAHEPS